MLTQEARPKLFSQVAGQDLLKKTLRAMVKNPKKAPKSIFIYGEYGTGKCVPGDVRVMTEFGYVPIKSLYKDPIEGFNPMQIKIQSRYGIEETSHFYYEKNCKVYNIELSNGSIIKGTNKHKILGYNPTNERVELIRMDKFSVGDYVFKNTSPMQFGKDDVYFAYVLGLFIASGSKVGTWYTFNGTLSEIDSIKSKFPSSRKIVSDKRLIDHHRYQFKSEFLDTIFPFDFSTRDRYIPEYIYTLDIRSRVAFIHGLMDAKGESEEVGEIRPNDASKKITYDIGCQNKYSILLSSEQLYKDLCDLCDSLGLAFSLERTRIINHKKYWVFVFKHYIPSTYDTLNLYYSFKNCPSPLDSKNDRNIFPVPPSVIDDYEDFYANANYKSYHLRNMKRCGKITERTILKLAHNYGYTNELLSQFVGLFSVKVKKIYFTYEDVYDLTVPSSHEFIAQGIANHNTTSSRIFAKAINCLSPTPSGEPCLKCNHCIQDINNCIYYNEYDSSTIGNTESMEQLKDKLSMTVEGYTIINIFDECHLASSQAQSKLLKTIEEAPYGVIFIFCTTHPDKVIPTIKSRSLMVEATLVGRQDIINNLRKVSKDNNIEVNDQILGIIATKAKGHMRNAHMLLDSYILLGDDFLDAQSGAREEFIRYLGAILKKDRNLLLKAISGLSTRPISTLKDELDGLLLDLVELDLKQDPTNDLMKYSKALKPILLDFIRVYNEPWVSFESDLTAQTSLMAIYQILERR